MLPCGGARTLCAVRLFVTTGMAANNADFAGPAARCGFLTKTLDNVFASKEVRQTGCGVLTGVSSAPVSSFSSSSAG
jgi:hypothetical protein